MNTQNLKIGKSPVIYAFVTIAMLTGNVFGQNNGNGLWQAIGPDSVFTKRFVKIKNSLLVKDEVTSDILHANKWLQLGSSTFFFVPDVPPIPLTDHIRSDNGRIVIMAGDSTTFNSNISVGIGTQTPVFSLDIRGDSINTNGDILSRGLLATGANPAPGLLLPSGLSGPRFIWYPGRAALRAGAADAPSWDSDSIGTPDNSICIT